MAGEFMSTESLSTCLGGESRQRLVQSLGSIDMGFGKSMMEEDPGYLGRHRLEATKKDGRSVGGSRYRVLGGKTWGRQETRSSRCR